MIWYQPWSECPLPLTDDVLYVAYSAPAEWSYFLAAGWELPLNIVDLNAEHALVVNGQLEPGSGVRMKTGLLRALAHFNVQINMGKDEKQLNRDLILRGAPYTCEERDQILEYCWTDVANTILLLEAMAPNLAAAQALNRGDFTRAVACYEYEGIPVDKSLHDRLQANWTTITSNLARQLEDKHRSGVYRCDNQGQQHWSDAKFAELVERRGLAGIWPMTATGKYKISDPKRGSEDEKVFKNMATIDPYLEPVLLSNVNRLQR